MTSETISARSGLTTKEEAVLISLVAAWESYLQLENNGGDDMTDFRRAIHDCQRILMSRIVARDYPETWK